MTQKASVQVLSFDLAIRAVFSFCLWGRWQCSAQQASPYTPHSARIELLSQFKDQKGEFLKSWLSVRSPSCGPESAENERQEDRRSLVVARRVPRERARGRGRGAELGGGGAGLHAPSVQDAGAARAHKTRQHSHQLRGPEQR